MAGYLSLTDSGLNTWTANFSGLITAAPTSFGLVAGDATALASALTLYSTRLAASSDPATKTKVTVSQKNLARKALLAKIRELVAKVQATPTVTADQKVSLGITVRDTEPTRIERPGSRPVVTVVEATNLTVVVRSRDETTPDRRARPQGVVGAEVYSFLPTEGQTAPADLEEWRFEGVVTRSQFVVGFKPADATKDAVIVARWINPRGEAGPTSEPAFVRIPKPLAQAA